MLSELFEENIKAPKESILFLSKAFYIRKMAVNFIWILMGGVMIFFGQKVFGIILICFTVYQSRKLINVFSSLHKKSPQLTLSSVGISLYGKKPYSWNSIRNEKIIVEPNYSASAVTSEFLIFEVNGTEKKILISNLNTSSSNIEYLLYHPSRFKLFYLRKNRKFSPSQTKNP